MVDILALTAVKTSKFQYICPRAEIIKVWVSNDAAYGREITSYGEKGNTKEFIVLHNIIVA